VEADESTDPKKFIQQLAGKLATSLRDYQKETGQPDFDLEKFAINSVVAATNTSEMDDSDRKDIIKKINTAKTTDAGAPSDDSIPDESSEELPDPTMDDEPNVEEITRNVNEILGMHGEESYNEPVKDNIKKIEPELNAPTMKTNFRTKGSPFTKPKYIPR